ncbi:2,4-dienoyl-coa reductase-like protein [Leishmania panamensis]|uniref:2,4-dienoyl-coa reductase-like protein n=1 Tax=Leishmania panamensis TaxID=5679 RepID=A0A088RKJ1_LEIPA|nr:2,4-dienoyl-coa reductase-like protein [Leishmania panamensis]AIN95649.1 2,4-dienoyl-coa reductase-like protein [Leishmania panamensis]
MTATLASPASMVATTSVAATAAASRLFTPLRVGRHIQLPNRFYMQPIYLNMESELKWYSDEHMAAMAAFFGERAHYGAKLMVVGGLGTSRLGRWKKDALMLGTFDAAKALSRVTRVVHSEGGYVLAQAFHAGRAARKRHFVSATSTPSPVQPVRNTHPYRIPAFMVNYVVSEYERFARLAEDAGFDGVEIPVSEGSLLHNFLSSAVNTRSDAFGGSLERRLEVTVRVLETIKNSLANPDRFVVSLRLCLHDLKPGGTSMAETLQVAEVLAKSGRIDLLNTSVGMHDSPVQTLSAYVPHGAFTRSCQLLKERLTEVGAVGVPVVASHRLHTIQLSESLLEKGVCDMVGVARPLLADPQYISNAAAGRSEDSIPCIGCNHCINRLYKHQRITCALNPITGYELQRGWKPAKYRKSVAVVGAGAAGVTCALTLWRRGHDVTLFEKESVIGGQLNLAKRVPGKENYQAVLEYWTRQLRQSSINVRLNTEFTREEVARNHQFFHAVVMTHGSVPRRISSHVFPGASECPLVVPFHRILDGSVTAGRRVVIVGNGAISHDVASFLLHDPRVSREISLYLDEWGINLEDGSLLESPEQRMPRNNRVVTIFNKADKDADLSRGWGWTQKLWIKHHESTVVKHGMIENFDANGVHISILPPDSRKLFVPCDTVVWCIGMLPNITYGTWIYEWMKDGAKVRGEMVGDFSLYTAGSCRDSYTGDGHGEEDLLQCVHEGYEIGYKI